MKKLLFLLSLVVGMASCSNEDEKFENIEFKTTGVTLSPLPNGISYYGEIDHTGGEMTFTASCHPLVFLSVGKCKVKAKSIGKQHLVLTLTNCILTIYVGNIQSK